ncbi:unnamed protein product [Schistosoma turkestanicum]|nr:unnamed protein product [Schistosoma turkestanicum]
MDESTIKVGGTDESTHQKKSTTTDENCLGCRVVGSVIPLTLSAYIIYACKDQVSKYAGIRKVSYLTLCTSMSFGLLYLGAHQLFSR